MQVHNRRILTNPVLFDDYQKLPGYSHSDIRNFGKPPFQATAKMMLGTYVHAYLNEPETYNHEHIEIVKPAAAALITAVGGLWKYLNPEVVVLADFVHNGLYMPFRGRIDNGIPNKLTIDWKISPVPLAVSIKRYGYDDQQNGYGAGYGADVSMIIRIDPVMIQKGKIPVIGNGIEIYNVPKNHTWWEYQILKFGKPYTHEKKGDSKAN